MKIIKLNPDLGMDSFNCLPPMQEIYQEIERLDRLATKQAKRQQENKNNKEDVTHARQQPHTKQPTNTPTK